MLGTDRRLVGMGVLIYILLFVLIGCQNPSLDEHQRRHDERARQDELQIERVEGEPNTYRFK